MRVSSGYGSRFSRALPCALLIVVALLLVWRPLFSRQEVQGGEAPGGGPQNERGFTLRARSELVLLDVSVRDLKGGFVSGLKRDNFQVYEEGRREPITQFGNTDTPVTIGLVIDSSGSMRSKRAEVAAAGLAFAAESNPHDEFFVVNFNDRVVRGLPKTLPFTDNLETLRRALYFGPSQGRTALYDAIAASLEHIRQGSREKRTLIVVSDGGDNASAISFRQLLGQIQASLVTVYAVANLDPEDRDLNPGVLRKITQVSGGEFFLIGDMSQVAPVLHQIAQDVRNRYTIGYVPDPNLNRVSAALRHIRVAASVEGRKLAVRTRTSYRLADPDDPPAVPRGRAWSLR